MRGETFSLSEAFRFGWDGFKRNLGVALGLGLAWFAVILLLNGMAQITERYVGLTLGFSLLAELVDIFMAFVWIRFALGVVDGRSVRLHELLPEGTRLLDYLAVSILYGALVLIGLVALVIPGIYLAVRFAFVGFLVADGRAEVLGAFRQSSTLTTDARWKLLLFGFLLLLLNLAGAFLFGIGLVVTVPISALAAAHVYRRLLAVCAERERVLVGAPGSPPMPMPA